RSLVGGAQSMAHALPRILQASGSADLLHVALPTPAFSWVGDLLGRRAGVPVLVSYEGHLAQASEALAWHNLRRGAKSWLTLWGVNNGFFGRLGHHHCRRYIVSTELQRHELEALGVSGEDITVVPNIVDRAKLRRLKREQARQALGLTSPHRWVGYVGHFNQVKGVDTLARAFVQLAQRDAEVELVLAWSGQGSDAPVRRILRPVSNRVHWLGKVDVGTFLSAIDVLALPYRSTAGQSAIPALVIEALHMGRPLVTARLPLLEEVLEDGETALLSTPNAAGDLAANLERLLGDAALARHMVASQLRASWDFAPERLCDQYEELYSATLAGGVLARQVA
ncbi:MAG: glycosyltransferase family 4 protein, partial [Chloroflexota bacterium]